MRELTIKVPDELFGPVKKLLANLRGARVTHTRKLADAGAALVPAPPLSPGQQQFVAELQQSLREAAAFERGELALPTWDEVRAQQRAAQPQPTT